MEWQTILSSPIVGISSDFRPAEAAPTGIDSMRFTLLDRIIELEPGAKITAVKNLSMAEEYLADHFPGFPVMPGVLMLEAVVEASAWLWRITSDFEHSVIVMREAKNV